MQELPQFGRRPFSMSSENDGTVGVNPYLDMVYRMPMQQGMKAVPVGVVSKNYRLLDHHQVLRTVEDAIRDAGIRTDEIHVQAVWTTYGERAHFSLLFPAEDKYRVSYGATDELRFRIEIFNSVEGSSRFMAVAGWLRFVCSNGLIIGTTLAQYRQQHRQQLDIEEFGQLLETVLANVAEERSTLKKWESKKVIREVLPNWVDEHVTKQWGLKAAVRTFAIVQHGVDAKMVGDKKARKASDTRSDLLGSIPGLDGPAKNLFDVSQALSWLAGQRQDVGEEIQWRAEVANLIQVLESQQEDFQSTAL